jgi:hypothetical protein
MKAASALDYRELARRRLPPFLFEYIDGGSYAEVTLRRNVADLEDIALRQRVSTMCQRWTCRPPCSAQGKAAGGAGPHWPGGHERAARRNAGRARRQ